VSSLVQAVGDRDPLLAGGLVMMAMELGVLSTLTLLELRRTLRSGEGSLLGRLGVGSQRISAKADARLQKVSLAGVAGGYGTPRHLLELVPLLLPLGFVLVTGAGVHERWYNRLSAVALLLGFGIAWGLPPVWIVTLKVATTLCEAKIAEIAGAVGRQVDTDTDGLSDAEWDANVARAWVYDPIVTFQYSATSLCQVSYHIQYLFFRK
jgi:hypothetical protein